VEFTASRPGQPGLLALVPTVEPPRPFLAKTFTYGHVVTAHETRTMVEPNGYRPVPMVADCELEDLREATTVAIHAAGARHVSWLGHPVMARAVRNGIADLQRLRICLEC
jgi:hypothetical protein